MRSLERRLLALLEDEHAAFSAPAAFAALRLYDEEGIGVGDVQRALHSLRHRGLARSFRVSGDDGVTRRTDYFTLPGKTVPHPDEIRRRRERAGLR